MNIFNIKPKINKIYKLRQNRLLYPEGIVTLNDTAYKILSKCDGTKPITEIKSEIFQEYLYSEMINNDINEMIEIFYEKKWID